MRNIAFGIHADTEGAWEDKPPRRAVDKAPSTSRAGRLPKEKESEINDADLFKAIGYYFPKFLYYIWDIKDFRKAEP